MGQEAPPPPPLRQRFGFHEWLALLCLLSWPLTRSIVRVTYAVRAMFPDSATINDFALTTSQALRHDFPYAAILAGLLSLTGPKRGRRLLWMAVSGLLVAVLAISGKLDLLRF